ncbi:MAG: SDR family oxidoreductase [Candidatus Pacebacteria bacterium]|nr:SDR family oxidoreductase [Candidatus Paceibacterota bacterium]
MVARDKSLFCFGFGFSACEAARLMAPQGWTIAASHRRPSDDSLLRAAGVSPFLFTDSPIDLRGFRVILVSAPPNSDEPNLGHHDSILQMLEGWKKNQRLKLHPECRIIYLSTTGVYGDYGQAWVDETSPTRPSTDRGQRRLAAEQAWQDFATRQSVALTHFRLAGIYGPGRSVLDIIRAGKAQRIYKEGQVFSRIHVADIAAAIRAAALTEFSPDQQIYNLCDDLPCPPQDVVTYGCELLGVIPPPLRDFAEVAATLSPMAASFYSESKKVSNQKYLRELKTPLLYPTYHSGLKAILVAEKEPPTG